MKKFLSVFLIAVMLLCTGIPAYAKNAFYPVTYDVQTPSTISEGEEFTISIGVDKMKNLALSGRIDISFDTYALKYISSKGIGDNVDSDDFYQTSPFGSTVNDTQPGKVIIAYYSYDVCPEDYVKIIEIKFRALSSGNTDISIATVDLTVEIDGVEYFWDSGSGAQIHTLSVTQGNSDPVPEFTIGDVNGDEKITAADARLTLRTSAKIDTFSEEQRKAADVNFDNKITAADARMILRVSAKIDSFDIPDGGTVIPPTEDKVLTGVEIHNIASKYTVEVNAQNDQYVSTGSGFFISDDGQVVTNYHVIDGMYEISVTDYSNNTYKVDEVLAFNADMDIAVLKVDAVSTPAVLNPAVPATGSDAYTLGSSTGLADTFSNGIISNGSRVVEDYNPNMTYIQTSAPISNGNSGGPLINNKAEVIGINTWGITSGQNLNFAIPVKYLDELDYSNPMTMSEFASLFRPTEPDVPDSDTLSLDIMTHVRYLDKGGTAIIEVEVIGDLGDGALIVNYDTKTLYCEWAEDWYVSNSTGNDIAYLFVSALKYSSLQYIRICVEGYEDSIYVDVPIEVTDDGWYDYGGYVGAVDYGAYLRIPPYVYYINETATGIGFYYSLTDIAHAGYDADDIMTEFFDYLAYYGYEYIGYENEGYTFYCAEYDIYYSFTVIYDSYGNATDIMIIFVF